MQIDWFTFGAQIVNFLILVGLLKRFLYGPILDAMDRREAAIAERINEAQRKEEAAAQEAERYRSMQAAFQAHRSRRMQEVEEDAEAHKHQLVARAREDVAYLERQWREAVERERADFLHTVSERAVEETIALARRVLDDLASAPLEREAVTVFLRHLQDSDGAWEGELSEALTEALGEADGEVMIRSAYELRQEETEAIRHALQAKAGRGLHVTTAVDPELGLGIEIQVAHRTVAWTLQHYLDQLLSDVLQRLQRDLDERIAANAAETSSVMAPSRS